MAKLKSIDKLTKEILDNVEIMVNDKTSMTLMECVEKQIAKKILIKDNEFWNCPNCETQENNNPRENGNYCRYCGQKIS